MPGIVEIIPFSLCEGLDLDKLFSEIRRVFRMDVRVSSHSLDPKPTLDRQRHQHHSTALLASLLKMRSPDASRVVGLTSVDLFVPILTFVFGEAQLDGPAAVVSTCRLSPEFYGLPPNPSLLHDRLTKETVHELAHTFGLVHCRDQACVLYSSSYAERIDLKSERLCMSCNRQLLDRMG